MRKALLLLTLFTIIAAGTVLAQVDPQDNTLELSGELRVINALVGIGPVDVYLNDRLIGTQLAPETATPYLALPPGRYMITVYPAGADPLIVPIADFLIDLPTNHSKTAVVYQTQFATPGADTANDVVNARRPALAQSGQIMVLDDNRSPVQLGKTRLTALHLAPGTPGNLSIAYPSRASLLHEISLEQPYGDIDINAGVYSLTVVDADSPELPRLAFAGEQVFQGNVHYTLIIVPDIRPLPGVTVPLVRELTSRPRMFVVSAPVQPTDDSIELRLIHTAHSTAVVDVYIDNRLIVPRLSYGQYTEYIGLPTYSHLIELRRRDAAPDSEPLVTAEFDITQRNRTQPHWSLLLMNATGQEVASLELTQVQEQAVVNTGPATGPARTFNLGDNTATLVLLPDNIAQTPRGAARVRVLHTIDGALEISMFASSYPPDPSLPTPTPGTGPTPAPQPPVRLVEPVLYGAEANENEVPAGLYEELEFVAGTSSDIVSLTNHQLLPGMVHTFVLIGQPSGEPPIRALEIRDFGRGLPQERLYVGTITIISDVSIANVRRQPSNGANVVMQIENGTEVEVLGRNFDGTWVKIRVAPPGSNIPQDGWIFAPLINVTRLGDPVNQLSLPQVS